jgi:GNAT superfamily N-acetyltransferase
MRYRLLRSAAHDQRWLDRLRRSVYRDLVIATYGRWDEARHLRDTSECWARGDISIIEADGARVGMLQMFDQTGVVEIAEIQVQLSHQNRGIASRILADIIDQTHKRGKTVVLFVPLHNERAYDFGLHRGFSQASQTETHRRLECKP